MKDETRTGTRQRRAVERIGVNSDSLESLPAAHESGVNDRRILRSLRRIVRAVDLYSRELKATCGLTVPQLVCLTAIVRERQITAVALSLQVHLSQSTLVGILDRLEAANLIRRVRSVEDRRRVIITATDSGKAAIRRAPSPLQENLSVGLSGLPPDEQATIAESLEKIVALMEAHEIEVAPLLTLERKSYANRSMKHRRSIG